MAADNSTLYQPCIVVFEKNVVKIWADLRQSLSLQNDTDLATRLIHNYQSQGEESKSCIHCGAKLAWLCPLCPVEQEQHQGQQHQTQQQSLAQYRHIIHGNHESRSPQSASITHRDDDVNSGTDVNTDTDVNADNADTDVNADSDVNADTNDDDDGGGVGGGDDDDDTASPEWPWGLENASGEDGSASLRASHADRHTQRKSLCKTTGADQRARPARKASQKLINTSASTTTKAETIQEKASSGQSQSTKYNMTQSTKYDMSKTIIQMIEGKPLFKCYVCSSGFKSLGCLRKHALLHTGLKTVDTKNSQLESASTSTATTTNVPDGRENAAAKQEVEAQTEVTQNRDVNQSEIEVVDGKVRFKCDLCGSVCRTFSRLKSHKALHADPVKGETTQTFDSELTETINYDLSKTEIEMVDGKPTFKCDLCRRVFKSLGCLRKHKLLHADPAKGHGFVAATGEKELVCHVCSKVFTNHTRLRRHKITHDGHKKHACDVCTKVFADACNLRRHKLVHTGIKQHACPICSRPFALAGNLKKHMICHQPQRPHACDLCPKSFVQRSHLESHKQTHSGEFAFSCEVCGKSFGRAQHLNHHKLTHLKLSQHQCVQCSLQFASSTHLKQHYEKQHRFCGVCDLHFPCMYDLNRHNSVYHPTGAFSCTYCNKTFSWPQDLKNHINIHTGENLLVCDVCGKKFHHKGNFKVHMTQHSGVKSHVCQVCGASFTMSSSLKKHMQTHSDHKLACDQCPQLFSRMETLHKHLMLKHSNMEKNYVCDICSKAFALADYLKAHRKLHSDHKPFVCEVCNKGFHLAKEMRRHKKLKHSHVQYTQLL